MLYVHVMKILFSQMYVNMVTLKIFLSFYIFISWKFFFLQIATSIVKLLSKDEKPFDVGSQIAERSTVLKNMLEVLGEPLVYARILISENISLVLSTDTY